ncbi:putative repeat protein (TIGR01451 family) [Flavobacterium arsenatis]|uniref:Repeat protein (TIGR01451 family) n=1 Tax=Flavobacterium arsenatis TaxID=1484332 RepID=A0ABU1TKY3_9FLAO|nr:choice-of-anchor L domain-containing protein [Flavobacterium arsenatis]MDR6966506.1 putative repeat protein (TIGR01451 family) [Flavobacterium arsenatis]
MKKTLLHFFLLFSVISGFGQCLNPSNQEVSNITSTSAQISWQSNPNQTLWEIFLVQADSQPPTPNTLGIITNTNPYTLTNLPCNSTITFYLRATCNMQESDWTGPFVFQTASCGTMVSVDTNFTPTELVTDVLLNNGCVNVSNIITQGICGIGAFDNNEGSFPFEKGLVIRSGQVHLSAGTYTGNNNSSICSEQGDAELNAIIAASGQPGTVNDVSSIKFNFTALSNQLSFNFLFASNEYGLYQCAYSDVFGFILTDLETGLKQNLAIVPGTSTPVSTTTIRNSLYNTNCSAVNQEYFGSYNVDNPDSHINFIGQTVSMTASATLIPNKEYSLKFAVGDYQDFQFDSAVFIEGGSFSFTNQCQSIQLVAFVDENNNGIKDPNEINYNRGTFNYIVNDSEVEIASQTSNGNFYIFPENLSDSYILSFVVFPELQEYFSTDTAFGNVVYDSESTNIYYFPIANIQPYTDVEVSIVPIEGPVPGFTYGNIINYKNNGVTAASGTLEFSHDTALTLSNISQEGTTLTPNGFTYTYTDLQPNESRSIVVDLTVVTIPTISLGQVVSNTVQSINSSDIEPDNNSFELNQIVVGSYDPNDKLEAHGGKIEFDTFDENDYLFYTIRFQNTGTANAQFVRLVDYLDPQLDETTLRMINASHEYTFTRTDANLVWKFDAINLPPEMNDEVGSNGFVQFKIKPKPGFVIGDIIPNTAEIYFDYNPAIITNTFNTEFTQTLKTRQFTVADLLVYPNPSNGLVYINTQNTTENLKGINLYDVLGKLILSSKNLSSRQASLNVAPLSKGVYMIEITTENNFKQTKKLVVN